MVDERDVVAPDECDGTRKVDEHDRAVDHKADAQRATWVATEQEECEIIAKDVTRKTNTGDLPEVRGVRARDFFHISKIRRISFVFGL